MPVQVNLNWLKRENIRMESNICLNPSGYLNYWPNSFLTTSFKQITLMHPEGCISVFGM